MMTVIATDSGSGGSICDGSDGSGSNCDGSDVKSPYTASAPYGGNTWGDWTPQHPIRILHSFYSVKQTLHPFYSVKWSLDLFYSAR
jgi:hypothetical protein